MVSAFSPVNIAWVKYMGKGPNGPRNASFSMTLDSIGTRTRIESTGSAPEFRFDFEGSPYLPPAEGREKIHRFLMARAPFQAWLGEFGFDCEWRPGNYRIHTSNNVPAGTGIATSASGFSALTLAWAAVLAGNRRDEWIHRYCTDPRVSVHAAHVARQGSGSACRSFHGPFVEWTEDNRIIPFSGAPIRFVDFILLLETGVKKVSSSEAHERVLTSPRFSGRAAAVGGRIPRIKKALLDGNVSVLSHEVRNEALEMHELFHTSVPPFRYLNRDSEHWLSGTRLQGTPFSEALVTADAGANLHVFLPVESADEFRMFLEKDHPDLQFVMAHAGKGAFYDSQGF